jgi:hypothetical protein
MFLKEKGKTSRFGFKAICAYTLIRYSCNTRPGRRDFSRIAMQVKRSAQRELTETGKKSFSDSKESCECAQYENPGGKRRV